MNDAPPDHPGRMPPSANAGSHAAMSAVIGLVFLALGWPFAKWALARLTGGVYDTGYTWPDASPMAGLPVAYFDLELGAAWRDMGLFATGVVLLVEAVLYGVLMVRPQTRRTVLTIILTVAAMGTAANLLSAAMQWRAGFYSPVYALIGLVVCFLSATTANGIRREPVLQ